MGIEDKIDEKAKKLAEKAALPDYVIDKSGIRDDLYEFIGVDVFRIKRDVSMSGKYFDEDCEFKENAALKAFEKSARIEAKKKGANLVYAMKLVVDWWQSAEDDERAIVNVKAQLEYYSKRK